MPQGDAITVLFTLQAVLSLILCLLLVSFLRRFDQSFLRHWALSVAAVTLYAVITSVSLHLASTDQLTGLLADILSTAALAAIALHLAWLMLGAWEASYTDTASTTAQVLVLGGCLVAAIGGALLFGLPGSGEGWRDQTPLSPRHLLAGLAFMGTALGLKRALDDSGLVSAWLAPAAFFLFGLHQVMLAWFASWQPEVGLFLAESALIHGLGLPLQVLIGYSIIIWMLEIERRRSDRAMDNAERARERLVHFHMHDPVTGLPNRRQLQDQLSEEVQRASEKHVKVAVVAIGLHRFNIVAQALGWQKTDHLMRELAARLRREAPHNSVLGRVGERDFLLILPGITKPASTIDRVRRLIDACAKPLNVNEQEVFLNLTAGVCLAPDHEIDAVALVNMAQQAQMDAAERGEVLVIHETTGPVTRPHDLLQLERELRSAVTDGQFLLYFQPLISIKMRRISGFEALLRWQHPERGLLTPGSFLQEAVRLGVLDELEDQILAQSLSQLAEWQQDLSLPSITVSINLSAQRFQQPDLVKKIKTMCKRYKVNPVDLHLEITESTAMQDFEAGLSTIAQLRALGCKVCLDDFGTGYSSLAHLRRLEVDYVKLDRSFITNVERDPHERDMIRAVVDLIHSLGMTVLAEGVENRQQLGYLLHCRVDVVQGFLLGKPSPAHVYQSALDETQLVFGPDTNPGPDQDDSQPAV
ncbi:MAG: putative bifunctional diguanylate cyclase/phosphodiesterase [Wenzhouxiangella sp.]